MKPKHESRRRLLRMALLSCLLACAFSVTLAAEPKLPYQDTQLDFETRAADLVSRMTLDEKGAQMQNDAPAIPRLDVPAYDWWNEALHGVARAGGATVFPQAIGMAASFDVPLLGEVANAISDEARAKHEIFAARGERGRYQGLTFWSPNINIFRDPRWGRGQETYGEDPHLSARMGVAFVRGLQGDDPKYRKLDATAKHFAVHSGPEADRHHFDARPSTRDFYETYLPAFETLVREGQVAAVMGAYNRVYGESASASQLLLQDILRRDWGFKGYVMSDCWAIRDIWENHKLVATPEQAAALAVKNGTELNCGSTYAQYIPVAVRKGLLSEAEVDDALTRLFTARMRLGMFDPPAQVHWKQIPASVVQSPKHDALARRMAQESIVLLKNDGILPLSKQTKTIAVIGPTADDPMALLGNYYGTPAAPVTILQGLREALPQAQVLYARGTDLVPGRDDPDATPLIEPRYLQTAADGERGMRGEYFPNRELSGQPVLVRTDAQVGFRWDRNSPTDNLMMRGEAGPGEGVPADGFSIRWSGQLLPPVTGQYDLEAAADDGMRVYLDGKLIIDAWENVDRMRAEHVSLKLEAGRAYDIKLEYYDNERDAGVRLAWRMPNAKSPLQEAMDAATQADVVVFVGGLTGEVEGEEMKINYPGFAGGDRTDIRLPQTQRDLLQKLHATGKPVVLVLTTGSALAVDWAKQNLPAILVAWYPGQRGGSAVADVLLGDANPAGRLPVTFYKGDEKLPAFDDYDMQGRTYRYFNGQALYPFGHGLSYTRFGYDGLTLQRGGNGADDPVTVKMTLSNQGKQAGDEVVQLYLAPVSAKHARDRKTLRGFQRVNLQPGQSREVSFQFTPSRDLTWYDEKRKAYAVDAGEYEVQIGASSEDIRLRQTFSVEAN